MRLDARSLRDRGGGLGKGSSSVRFSVQKVSTELSEVSKGLWGEDLEVKACIR